MGLPVLRALSLCRMPPLPRCSSWCVLFASLNQPYQLPRKGVPGRRTSSFRGLLSVSLTLRPAHSRGHQNRDPPNQRLSHFVTSMPAPGASGWSDSRVGLHPLESAAFARRTLTALSTWDGETGPIGWGGAVTEFPGCDSWLIADIREPVARLAASGGRVIATAILLSPTRMRSGIKDGLAVRHATPGGNRFK